MLFYEYYDCIYSAEGEGILYHKKDSKLKISVPVKHYACFSEVYNKLRSCKTATITYKIYLHKEDIKEYNFNLCTKLETKKILRCLRKVVDFSYKFRKGQYTIAEYNKKLTDYVVLIITVSGNYAQHLWLTSMLRCFFEFPYNVAAKEACELQEKYKEIDGINIDKVNWINLYLTIAAKTGSDRCHGIVEYGKNQPLLYSYNEWKQLLKNIDGYCKIVDQIKSKFIFKEKSFISLKEENYKKGIESRAHQYVAAYKDKLSWKKK